MLTQEECLELFDYDAETGILRWKYQPHPRIEVGSRAGYINNGYWQVELFGMRFKAHRIIWVMHFGNIPEDTLIDHIDSCGLNNRLDNLRLATAQENCRNVRKRANTTSRFKGVSKASRGDKWVAQIQIDGKNHWLGTYNTEQDAYDAYCEIGRRIFGVFWNAG